jgi:lysyl endopeptidase
MVDLHCGAAMSSKSVRFVYICFIFALMSINLRPAFGLSKCHSDECKKREEHMQMKIKAIVVALSASLALSNAVANKGDDVAVVEIEQAVAVDAGNMGAQGFAQFESMQRAASPIINLAELSPEDQASLIERRGVQAKRGLALQIGIARDVPNVLVDTKSVPQERTADGGYAQRFEVRSTGALATRVGFYLQSTQRADIQGLVLRFGGANGQVFEVSGKDLMLHEINWSPVVDGDLVNVEISADQPLDALSMRVAQLSHLDLDPGASQNEILAKIGESDSCERDIVCRTSPPANFRAAADAVARMVYTSGGGSFLCTGTLLNNSNSPRRHMFWSANHCISSQTVANTLQTFWFYEATTCGGLTASSRRRTLTGGAFLRHNNASRDSLLLELKTAPPAGAVYAGWTSAAITSTGTAIEGIHHPAGDVKMYSLGSVTQLNGSIDGLGPFYRVRWTTGVTEGGSSGSGLFTRNSSGAYQLRGGLYGGFSFCTAPSDPDYYSRFADVYSSFRTFLSP